MREMYQRAEMEVVEFDSENVIATSGNNYNYTPGENETEFIPAH